MKKLFFLTVFLAAFSVSSYAQNKELAKEIEAVKATIQEAYVDGLQNEGDLAKIDKGFHPGFNLLGIAQGNEMWKLPIYTWKEGVKKDLKTGKKPKTTAEDKVSIEFLSVDVTGTAAVAKIEFSIGKKLTYVDYLSLLKFEDGWKIVSKIFYKFPEKKE